MTQILGQPCKFQVQDEVAAKKLAANRKKRVQKKKKKQQQQQAAAAAADRLAQEAKTADDCARLERMMESKPELRARFSDKVALEGPRGTHIARGGRLQHCRVPPRRAPRVWQARGPAAGQEGGSTLVPASSGGRRPEIRARSVRPVSSTMLQACIPLLDLPIGELCD